MKNHLIETALSIVISIPILFFVVPYIADIHNIIATFIALTLGIWASGYVMYSLGTLFGALLMKLEERASGE